jgi:hypothetical protein
MKKLIVILALAAIVCVSAFAADIQIGVAQNVLNTSFILDVEGSHFGFETSLGLPVVPLAVSGIEAIFKSGSSDDSSTEESGFVARGEGDEEGEGEKKSGFIVPAGAMANVYWRIGMGKKFSMRLGIQGDIVGLFGPDYIWTMAFVGPSVGFNFKFNDSFAMNFTSAVPFAVFLPDAADKYVSFYYSNEENVVGSIVLAIYGGIGAIGCQLARLSFKWSV